MKNRMKELLLKVESDDLVYLVSSAVTPCWCLNMIFFSFFRLFSEIDRKVGRWYCLS